MIQLYPVDRLGCEGKRETESRSKGELDLLNRLHEGPVFCSDASVGESITLLLEVDGFVHLCLVDEVAEIGLDGQPFGEAVAQPNPGEIVLCILECSIFTRFIGACEIGVGVTVPVVSYRPERVLVQYAHINRRADRASGGTTLRKGGIS